MLPEQTRRRRRLCGSVKGRIRLLLGRWSLRVACASEYFSLLLKYSNLAAKAPPGLFAPRKCSRRVGERSFRLSDWRTGLVDGPRGRALWTAMRTVRPTLRVNFVTAGPAMAVVSSPPSARLLRLARRFLAVLAVLVRRGSCPLLSLMALSHSLLVWPLGSSPGGYACPGLWGRHARSGPALRSTA
jgi:hypothetical protein